MSSHRRPFTYLLRTLRVAQEIDRRHLTQAEFAAHLGLSRSYWSQVLHRHRPLTPMVRQCLLRSLYLEGIPEEELWDLSPGDPAKALGCAP